MVGRECLRLLLADPAFGRIVAVGRRALPPGSAPSGADPARFQERVLDLDRLEADAHLLEVDRVFCALGTTMRQAGSREAFRAVDHDLPLEIARLALARGAAHFLQVSALGADPESRIFYNRVKGEVERAVLALPFRSTTIVRPSLLVGVRAHPRPGEIVGRVVGALVPGRYRPVRASDVARVLVGAARDHRPGARIIESEEIRALARAERRK